MDEENKNLKEIITFTIDQIFTLNSGQLAWRRKQIDLAGNETKKFLKDEPEDDIACFESNSELLFNLNRIVYPYPK